MPSASSGSPADSFLATHLSLIVMVCPLFHHRSFRQWPSCWVTAPHACGEGSAEASPFPLEPHRAALGTDVGRRAGRRRPTPGGWVGFAPLAKACVAHLLKYGRHMCQSHFAVPGVFRRQAMRTGDPSPFIVSAHNEGAAAPLFPESGPVIRGTAPRNGSERAE